MAKKVGLSFFELNELTMEEFVAFVRIYTDEYRDSTGMTRKATQEDIDAFYKM